MSSVTNSQNKYKASQKVHQSTDSKVGTPDQVSPGFGTAKVIESQSVPTTPPVPAKEGGFHGFKSDSPYTGRSENLTIEVFNGFQTPDSLTGFQTDVANRTGSKENQSPGGFMTQALSTSSTKNDADPVQADELNQVIQDLCLKGVSEPGAGDSRIFSINYDSNTKLKVWAIPIPIRDPGMGKIRYRFRY